MTSGSVEKSDDRTLDIFPTNPSKRGQKPNQKKSALEYPLRTVQIKPAMVQ